MGLDAVLNHLDGLSQSVWEEFWANERVNDRGLPVDVWAARAATALMEPVTPRLIERAVAISGLRPTQYVKMAQWVYNQLPMHVRPLMLNPETGKPSLDSRSRLPDILHHEDTPAAICGLLDTLLESRKSSTYKYQAIQNRADSAGRLCGEYIFNGAINTGRHSSHGLQMHNNPKKALDQEAFDDLFSRRFDMDNRWNAIPSLLKGAIRPMICSEKGTIVWVDWSQIEARALPYLTLDPETEPRMRVFHENSDLYMMIYDFSSSPQKHELSRSPGSPRHTGEDDDLTLHARPRV
jgi:DNA polymerase